MLADVKIQRSLFIYFSQDVKLDSDENDSEDEMASARKAAATQKTKGKKSGGFQSMGECDLNK